MPQESSQDQAFERVYGKYVLHSATHTPTHSKNVVLNYSDAEAKVREATSNDPWGPSSQLMSELAEYTFHV